MCSDICLACQSSLLSLFLLGFHLQCIWVTVKVLDLVYQTHPHMQPVQPIPGYQTCSLNVPGALVEFLWNCESTPSSARRPYARYMP